MSFELLPTLTYWLAALAVVAAFGIALAAGLTVDFLARNRRIRTERHESIRSYYGHFHPTH